MARGKLPFHVYDVPPDVFNQFNDLYRVLGEVNRDLELVEGKTLKSDQSRASTVILAADPVLTFFAEPGKKYKFRLRFSTNGNLKYRLLGPAAPTLIRFTRTAWEASIGGVQETAFMTVDGGLTGNGTAQLEGILHTGATGGPVVLNWAQTASNVAPTILYAGSSIQYSPIA